RTEKIFSIFFISSEEKRSRHHLLLLLQSCKSYFSHKYKSTGFTNRRRRLANAKTYAIQDGKDSGVVLDATKSNKHKNPPTLVHKTVMKKEFSRMDKGVANHHFDITGCVFHKCVQCDGCWIPGDGYPVGTTLHIVVDLTTPVSHGFYISYWRMMSHSGEMFEERIWVLIEVNTLLLDSLSDLNILSGTCWRCDKFSSYYKKLKMVLKVARKKMRRLMSWHFAVMERVDKLIKEEAHEMDVKEVQWSSQVCFIFLN
ncbi:hypothetical protein C5167_037613, partial [Papaver somniferum]